jgi:hypothetical protein
LQKAILDPFNLEQSHNLLDSILSNLEGLTPEQEIQKKNIELRNKMLKEKAMNLAKGRNEIQTPVSQQVASNRQTPISSFRNGSVSSD